MDTPKFPHHRDCEALTGITLDHLPRDGSLGRLKRFVKGTVLWRPDDAADRIYFLRTGRVALMTGQPHDRPATLRTIESGDPFGELRLCSVRTGVRGPRPLRWSQAKRRGFVQYDREGPVRVDVASLTEYLGRIVRGDRA